MNQTVRKIINYRDAINKLVKDEKFCEVAEGSISLGDCNKAIYRESEQLDYLRGAFNCILGLQASGKL